MHNVVTNVVPQTAQGNLQVNQLQTQQHQQQLQQQTGPNQANRQNIVIINSAQGMNPMALQNQRFAGIPQNPSQLKGQVGPQQIIHQKIISTGNEGLVQAQMQVNPNIQQQPPQIIQVHQGSQVIE